MGPARHNGHAWLCFSIAPYGAHALSVGNISARCSWVFSDLLDAWTRNDAHSAGYLTHADPNRGKETNMRRGVAVLVVVVGGVVPVWVGAQATGMPSYNAPYRAFQRSELGAVFSFPNGGGSGFEGAYRYASGTLDIGLRDRKSVV